MELNNALKKRFVDDTCLPIPIMSEPYFGYYIELYDNLLNSKYKLEVFESFIKKFNNQDEFFQSGERIVGGMRELIRNTETYKKLNSFDFNKEFILPKDMKQNNIYTRDNINRPLISIDLEKANFNVMKMIGLGEELNISNYNDLLNRFSQEEYYKVSKKIRQVIFGDLNPSRQQRLQKFVIGEIGKTLKDNGFSICSSSSDEIIVKGDEIDKVNLVLMDINPDYKFFKVEDFHLELVHPDHDFFVKVLKKGITFKNTPLHLFSQVYKYYLKEQTNEYDLLFYHDKMLAQFKEPLFNQSNTLNRKLTF